MRCCGTLEFLCDFHEQCHLTQRLLQEKAVENIEIMTRMAEEELNTKFNNKKLEKRPLKEISSRKNSVIIQSSKVTADMKIIEDDQQIYKCDQENQENIEVNLLQNKKVQKKSVQKSEKESKSIEINSLIDSVDEESGGLITKNSFKTNNLHIKNNNNNNNNNNESLQSIKMNECPLNGSKQLKKDQRKSNVNEKIAKSMNDEDKNQESNSLNESLKDKNDYNDENIAPNSVSELNSSKENLNSFVEGQEKNEKQEEEEKQEKETEEDESDKENTIPKQKTPLKICEFDDSNLENTSISSKQSNKKNESNHDSDQYEKPVTRRRSSQDTVLADITDKHCDRAKTAVSRTLFKSATESRITRGMKRERKSPIITRKMRRTDQKTIMECFGKINKKDDSLKDGNSMKTKRGNRESEDEFNLSKTEASHREEMNEKDKKLEAINNSPVLSQMKKHLKADNDAKDKNNEVDASILKKTVEEIEKTSPVIASPILSKLRKASCLHENLGVDEKKLNEAEKLEKSVQKNNNIERNVSGKIKENQKNEIFAKVSNEKNNKVFEEVKGNKRKSSTYGKISDLISKEQKETIEKFYKLDMSVIDDNAIKSNYYINDKKQVICIVCDAVYPRIDKCQVHIRGHLDMKPYRCTACDFATVTVTNIRCHIRKKHLKIKPFECHVCSKKFVTAVLLEEHINSHTGARPYRCKICEFTCASRQVLAYHNTSHKEMKDVECDICKKRFVSKGRLRAHIMIHNADKSLMCKYCSHHFTTSESLERHYKNVHSSDYICNVCGKRTKSRKALNNHQNVHSEAKYKCPICPCVYKNSYILKEHLLKHEGIRKYKCDVCGKDFAQQSHLAAHKAVHSEKRYFCPGCNRAFNRHDNMKMHTKKCDSFLANPELKNLLTRRSSSHTETNNVNGVNNNDDINYSQKKTDDIKKRASKNTSFRIGDVDIVSISDANVPVENTKVTVTRTTVK